jgi:hypothetical protein
MIAHSGGRVNRAIAPRLHPLWAPPPDKTD